MDNVQPCESTPKPDKSHIMVELYSQANVLDEVYNQAVVSVNQLVGITFLPQVAGVFFGSKARDRAEQLAFHIAGVSRLDIFKTYH